MPVKIFSEWVSGMCNSLSHNIAGYSSLRNFKNTLSQTLLQVNLEQFKKLQFTISHVFISDFLFVIQWIGS